MLNYLRYELHKTLKSKTIWAIVIIYLSLRMFTDIYHIFRGTVPFMQYYITTGGGNDIVFPVIGVVLATKDFSSGYLRNLYKQIKPWLFVLSKFITLIGLSVIIMLTDFILTFLVNLVFGVDKFVISTPDYPFSVWYLLTICLYYITSGCIGMAVGHLIRKNYIAIPLLLIWMNYCHYIYPMLSDVIYLIEPPVLIDSIDKGSSVAKMLHFEDEYTFLMEYIRYGVYPGKEFFWKTRITTFYVKEGVFILLSYLASWLSLKFRKVK